ncbi:hypothetical protein FHR83_009351 [Actinoplanes campanulatus]|uniref:Uncharacterized protein n=1 Tax=Actinoplanes campanulatus TaxID=113559 RepID=A0A7W5FKI5_9ACTN|nr:hypothetical protein [Actinoplanes campanulatus]MBB3101620.1 hypothetical protein [Actinoplanes campanulatus]GGN51699.1 hypothetical protein GCM10010109_92040 [Actinoplanes campanulatus]GID42680.1 hypothetical protein Aca09nite_91860 [Actinoplanes campanulatus]
MIDDDLSVRRWMKLVETRHRRRPPRTEMSPFDHAELALENGRKAEHAGRLDEALQNLRVAAREGVGDSLLLLSGLLVRTKRYAEALDWALLAEAEGFCEAVDLVARCRTALGVSFPERPTESSPADQAPIAPPAITVTQRQELPAAPGRGIGSTASADLGLTRRLKALACTVPLHELDHHKAKLERIDAAVYQMAEIAMHIIDQVTIAMDFDTGVVHEVVEDRVTPFVASQAPDRGAPEHRRVARWVLEKLINVGPGGRVFRHVYGEIDADGTYQRHTFDFKLIREVAGVKGEIYLRATDEAINVLVGALDTDVESAQVAAEVKLDNLINRGQLEDARIAAEQARYRTVQYGEMLRHKLDATRRNVRVVDWEHELPEMLDRALAHVEGRCKVEHAILRNITEARDGSEDPGHKLRAAELVDIVTDCIRRHTQLQSRLQSARSVFREEQDRQQFSGPPQRAALDLHGQLLRPLLELPVSEAVAPLDTFFRLASGVCPPDVMALPALVSMLLRPVADRSATAGPVIVPEVDPVPDHRRFTDEHRRRAAALLDLGEEICDLGSLLREAADFDDDLPVLVALRAAHAYSPGIGAAVVHGHDRVLLAVPAGWPIDPTFPGVTGDDLLLTTAKVVDAAADQPGTVLKESA